WGALERRRTRPHPVHVGLHDRVELATPRRRPLAGGLRLLLRRLLLGGPRRRCLRGVAPLLVLVAHAADHLRAVAAAHVPRPLDDLGLVAASARIGDRLDYLGAAVALPRTPAAVVRGRGG